MAATKADNIFFVEFFKKKVQSINAYEKRRSGFPPGRPRKGEVRPPSIGAISQAKYRADNPVLSAERNLEAQTKWRESNLERARAQKRAAYKRKKSWSTLISLEKVEKQIAKAQRNADKGDPRYER
jgi:hypothetical protein